MVKIGYGVGHAHSWTAFFLIYVFLEQGTSWQQNLDKFEIFAKASLQLCEAYIETSCNGGGVKELSAAIMHLRNTLKQVLYKACVFLEAVNFCTGFVDVTDTICINKECLLYL